MKKLLCLIYSAILFTSCDDPKSNLKGNLKLDEKINLSLVENEYKLFFVCEKPTINQFKEDLVDFRKHLNYNDTFCVNIYSYKGLFIASMPENFNIGQAAFLSSWIFSGFTYAKNKSNSNSLFVSICRGRLISKGFYHSCFKRFNLTF